MYVSPLSKDLQKEKNTKYNEEKRTKMKKIMTMTREDEDLVWPIDK